ncbi:MAG: response regulator [Anaerolineae bacterium]|nr:response regulator [Anaerolineae bacterium]NIN95930.1 response regulator [Anaerolineae bacterium]NIQ78894.1 response regulator [Anaerolineae bacterium]
MADPAKILLVDDDPDFVEATKIVLESAPYDVAVAYNGDEALKKVGEVNPDLIILDIIMPEQDGFKVCEALKSDPELSKIPVIMLTSLSQRMGETAFSVTDGMMLEADDYVDKPVTPDDLLKRVEKFLGRRR